MGDATRVLYDLWLRRAGIDIYDLWARVYDLWARRAGYFLFPIPYSLFRVFLFRIAYSPFHDSYYIYIIYVRAVQYPEVVSNVPVSERRAVEMLINSLPECVKIDSDEAVFAAKALYSVGAGVVHYYTYSEGRMPLIRRMMQRGIHDSHARRSIAGSQRVSEVPAWLTMMTADDCAVVSTGVAPEEEAQLLQLAGDMWKAAQALVERG
jgi:hypothetical protein